MSKLYASTFRLRVLDRFADPGVLERYVLFEAEPVHQAGDRAAAEAAHQVVLQGHEEARRAGVALAAGAAAQLVVDAARLVALGPEHVQPTEQSYAVGVALALGGGDAERLRALLGGCLGELSALAPQDLFDQAVRVAAEQDVDAAAGHVGSDGDRARPASLGDDPRLALVLLGVQDLVRHTAPVEKLVQALRLFDRGGADQHRSTQLVQLLDLVDDRVELGGLGLVDQVAGVLPNHRHVRGHRDDVQVVDLLELVALGPGGTRHAGQLLVHAEVVLEGDAGQGDVLALDAHALLGLDRLVQPFRIAPTRHQPAGELVDDDDLALLVDDVLVVALEQELRLEGVVQVMGQLEVLRVVDAAREIQTLHPREQLLDVVDALVGRGDDAVLLVDDDVGVGRLVLVVGWFWRAAELAHHAGEDLVELVRLFGRTRDDQRGARLVDEDVVDLVDDRIVQLALDFAAAIPLHVVAKVVETELVVGSVRDICFVGLPSRHRKPVIQPLVGVLRRIVEVGVVDSQQTRGQ